MQKLRTKLSYANVVATMALFLAVAGGTAVAANELAKNSVGSKQIKKNAVTAAKIKKNAVTSAKIKNNAVTGAKIDEATLGAVPNATNAVNATNSATTDVIKGAQGKLSIGQEALILAHGPLALTLKCQPHPENPEAVISPVAYISSNTPGTAFTSWEDGSSNLGPDTLAQDRMLNGFGWSGSSGGGYAYDSSSDVGVSATAANGQGFQAFIGRASEKDTNTCWYWMSAQILG